MSAPSRVDRSIVTRTPPASQGPVLSDCHAALKLALERYIAIPVGTNPTQITRGQALILRQSLQVLTLMQSALARVGLLGGGAR
jgi:hypothetical protein